METQKTLTTVRLRTEQFEALFEMERREGVARSAAIRVAVDEYLDKRLDGWRERYGSNSESAGA